jgi:hypothetical protein
MKSKQIKGVLHNLLNSYASRNSDYNGYWLFGFLVAELSETKINLLSPREGPNDDPLIFSETLAALKFRQMIGEGGAILNVKEASLTIKKLSGSTTGYSRYPVQLVARVVFASDRAVEVEKQIFVAVHNPIMETRSTRNR